MRRICVAVAGGSESKEYLKENLQKTVTLGESPPITNLGLRGNDCEAAKTKRASSP